MDRSSQNKQSEDKNTGEEITIGGCKVTLYFLPESDGKALDTVKKILTSSGQINISDKGG